MNKDIFRKLELARKKMNLIHEEVLKIEKEIEMFSTYDILSIGEVLSLLMSTYEGVSYENFGDNESFKPLCSSFSFFIEPVSNKYSAYSCLTLKPSDIEIIDIKCIEAQRCLENKKQIIRTLKCVLLPSRCGGNINISYVQSFIDYLFNDRVLNNVVSSSKTYLMNVLSSFLEKTLDEQCFRKKQISVLIDTKKREEQRRVFERLCFVDRRSMFNNICYLSNCCDDMSAEVLNEYLSGNSSVYQKIVINYNGKEFLYETLVDNIECYPDEIYDVYANVNKDTYINFFEIKFYLRGVISENEFLKKYFDSIEDYFNQQDCFSKIILNSDDLNSLLNLISYNYSKQKRLKVLD